MADSFHPELLSALLDGQLTPEQKAAVEEHLQSHPQEAALFDDLQRLRKQLRGLPSVGAPTGFQQTVLRRIRESAPIAPTVPVPSGKRSAANATWLFACAASLIAILLAGVFYTLNKNDPHWMAQTDRATAKSDEAVDARAAANGNPIVDVAGRDKKQVTKSDDQPVPSSGEQGQAQEDTAQPDADGDMAAKLQEKAMPDLADKPLFESADAAVLAMELGNTLAPPPSAEGFGGGLGGKHKDNIDSVEKDLTAQSKIEPSNVPAESVAPPATSADALVFVQVPAGQSADEWIASVFRQAKVQVDSSDEPNSFDALMQKREEDKKQAPAETDRDQAQLAIEESASKIPEELGERSQPELSPAPEYRPPDQFTCAYWVEAEVQQIRMIMERLDRAWIVRYPNPEKWDLHGAEQENQKSYDGKNSFAQKVAQLEVLADPGKSRKQRELNRQLEEDKSSESEQAIAALGLQYKPHTARYRVLFVFHGAVSPQVPKSKELESKPAPAVK